MIRDFCRSFYRAMGDRDAHLAAYKQTGIAVVVFYVCLGVVALSTAHNR